MRFLVFWSGILVESGFRFVGAAMDEIKDGEDVGERGNRYVLGLFIYVRACNVEIRREISLHVIYDMTTQTRVFKSALRTVSE